MTNRLRLYLIALAVLLVLYAIAEANRPKPQNWEHTYQQNDKIPHGTYALVELLPSLFHTETVTITRDQLYSQIEQEMGEFDAAASSSDESGDDENEQLTVVTDSSSAQLVSAPDSTAADATRPAGWPREVPPRYADYETEDPINYLFIAPHLKLDSLDVRQLEWFAAAGHHVFISTEQPPERLLQSLRLVARYYDPPAMAQRDSVSLRLVGDAKQRSFRFATRAISYDFRQLSPDSGANGRAETLGVDELGNAVLVRVPYGHGDFTFCSVPLAFTNYYVLRPATAGFAWGALSYLPPAPIWWDEFEKQGTSEDQSMLRVVYKHDALRLAFYLTIGGGLLLLWIGAKRRQRAIPLVKPLPNNTLQFVGTVAALYRQGDNHARIAHRKIDLFLDFVRSRYNEKTDDLSNAAFRQTVTLKSGLPRADIDELMRRVALIRTADWVSDGELMWLSQALSEFRKR
jgi:hypothetical protein